LDPKEVNLAVARGPARHSSRTISFHVTEDVAAGLVTNAAAMGITVSKLVFLISKAYLEQVTVAKKRRRGRKRKAK